jgi:hypothetical protein
MVSKVKVDAIESTTGSGTIALNNQFSGMTASSMPAGSVIQVKESHLNAATTFGTTSYADSGLTVTITPRDTASTFIISIWGTTVMKTATALAGHDSVIIRTVSGGNTTIFQKMWMEYFTRVEYAGDWYPNYKVEMIDTPATASPVTYKLQGRKYSGNTNNWAWSIGEPLGGSSDRAASLIVTEIAG